GSPADIRAGRLPEEVDEGAQRRRHVAAVVVVEVRAVEPLPPCLQYRQQPAAVEQRAQVLLEGVDDAGAGDGCGDFQVLGRSQQRALRDDPDAALALPELPDRELAALEPVADQTVRGQFAWMFRRAV